jgi:hypothetical protein
MISDHKADKRKLFSFELTMDRLRNVSGKWREGRTWENCLAERGKGDFWYSCTWLNFQRKTLLHLSSVFKLTQITMNANSSRSLDKFVLFLSSNLCPNQVPNSLIPKSYRTVPMLHWGSKPRQFSCTFAVETSMKYFRYLHKSITIVIRMISVLLQLLHPLNPIQFIPLWVKKVPLWNITRCCFDVCGHHPGLPLNTPHFKHQLPLIPWCLVY